MKPLIFISHIHEHSNLAVALKKEISNLLLGGVDFFVSSDRMSIIGGDNWLYKIESALSDAAMVLILCDNDSILRPWINFEAGGAWISKKRVVPLCHSGFHPTDLPEPLKSLQAYDLSNSDDLRDMVSLIASLANLKTPNFSANELVKKLKIAEKTKTPTKNLDKDVQNFEILPSSIELLLKTSEESFVEESDIGENARHRVYKEEKKILNTLSASLINKFGPKNVKVEHHRISFPEGFIDLQHEEDRHDYYHTSYIWNEITLNVIGSNFPFLKELKSSENALKRAKIIQIDFIYNKPFNINSLATELHRNKTPIKEFSNDMIGLDKFDDLQNYLSITTYDNETRIRISGNNIEDIDELSVFKRIFNSLHLGSYFNIDNKQRQDTQ